MDEPVTPAQRRDTGFLPKARLSVFLAVAFGGAWLLAIPLWVDGRGLTSPYFQLTAAAMMFTPSLGVVVSWLVARRRGAGIRDLARETGLGLGSRKRRTVLVGVVLWVAVPLFVVLAILLSTAVGWYDLDVAGLSLLKEKAAEMPGNTMPVRTLALYTLVLVPLAPLLNSVNCFGEEWGWRGFLMPRLLAYGKLRAILISGAIWGLWHAPLTLLGYNYPNLGPWAALMFVPFCVAFGALLSWSRLVTDSVWPAVVGHGALNGSSGLIFLAGSAGHAPNLAIAGPIGIVGIVLLTVVATLLFARTRGNVGFRPSGAVLGGR